MRMNEIIPFALTLGSAPRTSDTAKRTPRASFEFAELSAIAAANVVNIITSIVISET